MARVHTVAFLFLIFLPFLPACRGPLPTTIDAIDSTWELIKPEYVSYINLDPSISPDSKETRKRTAEILSTLIETAKKSYEEEDGE